MRYGRCKLRQSIPHGRGGRCGGKMPGGGGYGADARLAAGPGGGLGGMMGLAWQREAWGRDRGQGYPREGGARCDEVRYDEYDEWAQPDPEAAHYRGGAHAPRLDVPAVPLCLGGGLPLPHSHKRSHEHAGLARGPGPGLDVARGLLPHGAAAAARHAADAFGHGGYHHGHGMGLDPPGGFGDGGGRARGGGMDADDGRGMDLGDG